MDNDRGLRSGIVFALLAYGAWGVIPLYWRLLDTVPPTEILAFRVVFSLGFLAAFLAGTGSMGEFKSALAEKKTRRMLALSSVLIGINWGIFILAIQIHHLADASLGYFMNPLGNVLIGVLLLREKLRRLQTAAVVLAAVALLLLVILGGGVPWIAIVLAASFAIYGLVRKTVAVGATAGLMVETVVLAPIAFGYLAWLARNGVHALGGPRELVLAAMSGPITAVPLIWFSRAARALPLSTLGLTQYLAPTGQFLIAVLMFGESMPALRWAAFGLIWIALVLFSIDLLRATSATPKPIPPEPGAASPRSAP